MWFNFMPFFVQVIVFVVFVRIIVGAVAQHDRRVRAQVACCRKAMNQSTPVGKPAQESVAVPATVTEVKSVEAVPVESVHEAHFCPSCGAPRSPTARFCTMCGSEL